MSLCGGISNQDEPANDEIQGIIEQVKVQVLEKVNADLKVFEAISYRTQVVAGKNYFVKVHIGNENYIHLRIYKNFQQEVSLHSLQHGKSKEDSLQYF